uniref:protein kinase C n=1 Tax=Taenia asiatica TaxID=60517 RepID=A0A0R3VTT5_TAEAS
LEPRFEFQQLLSAVQGLYHLTAEAVLTMKWIDDEGDPCMLTSDAELKEAIRLYEINKEPFLAIHVFNGAPSDPGMPCPGEDFKMYRRGAKRWNKKFYHLKGHNFLARRFNKNAVCSYCGDRIWGLGQQGYKCNACKLLIHKRCAPSVDFYCGEVPPAHEVVRQRPVTVSGAGTEEMLVSDGIPNNAFLSSSREMGRGTASERKGKQLTKVEEDGVVIPQIPVKSEQVCLDHFKLLRVIGRGSYAKVFQVEYKPTSKIYAMKVIKKEIITDEEDIDWVQTEKHVFEIASNHPFLFINGGDLMYHMQRQCRLHEDHAKFYAAEICIAMNFLHERQIVYRDLKLDNVLMDLEGHIKLTDYGMCKEGISETNLTSTFCGTPNYIAPEILRSESYSFSVDWWALGVLMFEMVSGRSPWEGIGSSNNPDQNTEEYLFQVILTKPIRYPRSISVKASNILQRFLNKDPTERLGCAPNSNFADIQNQPFFASIDWVALEQKRVQPPYRPEATDDYNLIHFDPTFTNERVCLTPDDPEVIRAIDQSEFDGFEYLNPLLIKTAETV